ncbi:sugar nucleotide-binding protein [Pseudoalteromonas sp. MMG013]|uniref:sugar nucleotide-binding protein n=1 Tax=Pseudoalteromonas sp. MMG013 TaxID=2822687 RepID=UPI001B35F099|nr:sugar nucleotide-binding protein [Pseudoalteromonas sp. MMG013]MBQ4861987.1 sugar nucleotide-binding protein [Pseudoalteromonas sp. MMG013]
MGKSKVLVVGGDSFLGKQLGVELDSMHVESYLSTRRKSSVSQYRPFLDLLQPKLSNAYDHVVLLAGIWNYHACATDPDAYTINVINMIEIAQACWNKGAFVTFISTNTVFGGDKPWCNEDAPLAPSFPYAQHKVDAELGLQKKAKLLGFESKLNIIRLTKILDSSVSPLPSWLPELANNNKITPFSDLVFAPITREFASQSIAKIALSGIAGTFHLSGEKNVKYDEFAKNIAITMGHSQKLIEATTSTKAGIKIPFLPLYSGLGMRNTNEVFKIAPQPLQQVVSTIVAQYHAKNSYTCKVCHQKNVRLILNFGPQPICNNFQTSPNTAPSYKLTFGQCTHCSTAQLVNSPSIEDLRPRLNWLAYNEPETHLDEVVKQSAHIIGFENLKKVLGATYKDASMLSRYTDMLECSQATIQPQSIPESHGLETIQQAICDRNVIGIKSDLVIARHLIEHSDKPVKLLKELSSFIDDTGYILIELPASEHIFEHNNHPFIWEEHFLYFTESSVDSLIEQSGLVKVHHWRFKYDYEDSLVLLVKKAQKNIPHSVKHVCLKPVQSFAKTFLETQCAWQTQLKKLKQEYGGIAVFGAGHMCIRFINFYQLSDYIDYVIDDNPNKIGMYLPGSDIIISASVNINVEQAPVCISTLSPESEARVVAKNTYLSSGVLLIRAFKEHD